MRESGERKAATRRRIMDAAAALFREEGIDGVGVDAIMQRAGLTHGGFYGHFPSKEALAAEVCGARLAGSAARWAEIRAGAGREEGLRRIVGSYLDPAHVLSRADGCMLPTLGADLARRAEARAGITGAIRSMIQTLADCLPGRAAAVRRQRALAGLSCMVGAVVLARLAGDSDLGAEILAAARAALGAGEDRAA